MFSLTERFDVLQRDLLAQPMRISSYSALPFAILQYEPREEWEMRGHLRRLIIRLQDHGKQGHQISLAQILWETIAQCESMEDLMQLERQRGFAIAQSQVTTYFSDDDFRPLVDNVTGRLTKMKPERDVVFIWRAAALAPNAYHLSKLLDEMQYKTEIPVILLYPGRLEGPTGLRFMALPGNEASGNYRVKIYGEEYGA